MLNQASWVRDGGGAMESDLFWPPPRRLCFCRCPFICLVGWLVCEQDYAKTDIQETKVEGWDTLKGLIQESLNISGLTSVRYVPMFDSVWLQIKIRI